MEPIAVLALNPAIDAYYSVRQFVVGRKIRSDLPIRIAGGGGINVARTVLRLGGTPTVICTAGGDGGDLLVEKLREDGLDLRVVAIDGETRENLTIVEEATGQHLRLVMPGPALHATEWRRALEELERLDPRPKFVVASGSLPPGVPHDFYARVAQLVKGWGGKFILDAAGEPLRDAAREGVYLLKPNLRELERLAHEEIATKEQQEVVSRHVVEQGECEVVVLSLGGAGVVVTTREGTERFNALNVPMRSKIGAGDSMVAGIVVRLAEGASLREAVLYGMAAGAAAVMTAERECCCRDDVDRLYRRLTEEAA